MKLLSGSSDQELINLFMEGNENAFKILVFRHKKKIHHTILFLVRDHFVADDIFQDVFIRIFRCIKDGRYSEEGKFLPWAVRIAQNICLDHLRKVKRSPSFVSQDQPVVKSLHLNDESFENKMLSQQVRHHLNDMLNYLPEEQRTVIVFRHFHDMKFKDIASVTNCSVSTTLGRMRYGLTNLRKIMTQRQIVME